MDLNYLKELLTVLEEAQFNAAFGNLEKLPELEVTTSATYGAILQRRINIEREFKEFKQQALSLVKGTIRRIEKEESGLKVRKCKCGRHLTDRKDQTCMSCQEQRRLAGIHYVKLTPVEKEAKKKYKEEYHVNDRLEIFWSKVKPEGDCWIWQAGKDKDGYGCFRFPIDACNNKTHRVAFWTTGNVLIKGMEICHECDNPSCVRPSHLFQDTHVNNNKDMHRKGRGNNQYNYVGTCADPVNRVIAIREDYVNGKKVAELSREYKLGKYAIKAILSGKSWKELLPEEDPKKVDISGNF